MRCGATRVFFSLSPYIYYLREGGCKTYIIIRELEDQKNDFTELNSVKLIFRQ